MRHMISVDPSRTRAYGALWRAGCVSRVEALSGYQAGFDSFDLPTVDLFVTEQVTVFGGAANARAPANARALIQVACDAGLRAGPFAARGIACVALTPSEWRGALGVQGAHKTRSKRAVDADVREVVLRLAPGAEAALAPHRGARGALPQDSFDAIAIGLAAGRMRARLGHDAFVAHHAMPRDLGKSHQDAEPEAARDMIAGATLEPARDWLREARNAYDEGVVPAFAELNRVALAALPAETKAAVRDILRGAQ